MLLMLLENRPESLILLLFFVMYMAFMVFCAQTKRNSLASADSHQSSLTSSCTSSTDSAIAECGNRGGHVVCNNKKQPEQQDTADDQQQVYGQYYLANATQSANFLNNYNVRTVSELTPLVTPAQHNKSCEVNYQVCDSRFVKANKGPQLYTSEPNLIDSVSIDLGVAIKNSTCLVKRVGDRDDVDASDYDEHNWLNSNWILLPMFPLTLSMKILTPLKFKNTCWTIWTFIVSICLIGGLTYVSVWMVHSLGQTLGIPETVAGMTILSWGTGIPELVASIVLIKKTAQADMAICNTIGSNVIDASFCLSLPWLVKCILNKAAGLDPEVRIQSAALPWTSFTLLMSVVLLLLILKFHNWELSCSAGIWLTVTYGTFVAVATYLESSFSQSGLDLFNLI